MEAIILSFLQNWGAMLLSALSILIAVISLSRTSKAQQLQSKVNELDVKIKQYELEKAEKEANTVACIEARVICIASGKYRLKVWNSGNATAYNVSAKFNDDADIIIADNEKMPYEELESKKSFEMVLIVSFASMRKFKITTSWRDSKGEVQTKMQMGDM